MNQPGTAKPRFKVDFGNRPKSTLYQINFISSFYIILYRKILTGKKQFAYQLTSSHKESTRNKIPHLNEVIDKFVTDITTCSGSIINSVGLLREIQYM